MKYLCNPVNINYRYQFNMDPRQHGKIFASMTLGVWVSDDLSTWENHRLPGELPLYDYAPDVRVMGDWVYFCASRREENCDRYRTKDILNGPYEKIQGSFPFWDPNLFNTMQPKGDKRVLVEGHPFEIGYERVGEDNSQFPATEAEIDAAYAAFHRRQGISEDQVPEQLKPLIRGMFSRKPYIEGAWMDKQNGKYYLQYACPGTQYNTYSDGVYVSSGPRKLRPTWPLYPGRQQSLFLQAGRLSAWCRTWQYHAGQERELVACRNHADQHESRF